MINNMKRNPVPKVIALLLVSIVGAWMMLKLDASALSRLDGMSATDYIQKQRELHQHTYIFHFVIALILGGFYLGVVEFLTSVIRFCFPRTQEGVR